MHHVRCQHTAHTSVRLRNSHQCQQQTPTTNDQQLPRTHSLAHASPRSTHPARSSPHHTDTLTHLPLFPQNRDKRARSSIRSVSEVVYRGIVRFLPTYMHTYRWVPCYAVPRRQERRQRTSSIPHPPPTFAISAYPAYLGGVS